MTYTLAQALIGNDPGFTEQWYEDEPVVTTTQSLAVRVPGPRADIVPRPVSGWRRVRSVAVGLFGPTLSLYGRATQSQYWTTTVFGTFGALLGVGAIQEFVGEESVSWVFVLVAGPRPRARGRRAPAPRPRPHLLVDAPRPDPRRGSAGSPRARIPAGYVGSTRLGTDETPEPEEDDGHAAVHVLYLVLICVVAGLVHGATGW